MYNGAPEQAEYSDRSQSDDEDDEVEDTRNLFINPNLLFKLKVSCTAKNKNWDFQVIFLNFEAMELFVEKESLNLVFPMTVEELSTYISPNMDVMAVEKDTFKGSCTFNVAEQIDAVLREIKGSCTDYPITVKRQDKGKLVGLDSKPIGDVEVEFEFSCLGPNLIQEMEMPKPEEEKEEVPQPEDYDEYSAEINGHSLNIRMLRKKKEPLNDNSCHCPSGLQGKKLNRGIPPGGVGRKNSQIIFQMPNNAQLCKKNPQNAMMYNVGTCPQMDTHGHGPEQIKILSGNSEMVQEDKTDTFVIRIGKKTPGAEGKGRLELELKAPKPLTPEDFKKPCRDIGMQTDKQRK